MTFRIRARSNIKDSMTLLIAEPPLRCPDEQPCQGDPVDINAPARSLHRQRGHQADRSSWLPTSRRIGEAELTLGIPYAQTAEGRAGGGGHRDGHRRRRGEILGPDPRALQPPEGRTMERRDTLRPEIRLVNAGRRSKAPGVDQTRREEQKGSRQQGRVPAALSRERYTRGPRAPGVASSQTFRTGGSVPGTTRARLRGVPRDQPLAYALGARLTRHAGQPHA